MDSNILKVLGLCLSVAVFPLNGQDLAKQNCPKTSGPSYKVGYGGSTVDDPLSVFLQVKVDKKYFNKKSVIELVKKLRTDYCKASQLTVTLFDDLKLARDPANLFVTMVSHGKIVRMRGFYNLNRKTGEEGVEFSSELGKPTTQMQVSFKDGEPLQ